jgi:hypothetical protein
MSVSHEDLRQLLCELGSEIRSAVAGAAAAQSTGVLSQVEAETEADTIYAIDRYSEEAITAWLAARWPANEPVRLVMEGVSDDSPLCFPAGTADAATRWTLIVDPIDGTRGIMYDKRSAWALAGIAPHETPGARPTLADIQICAMTELPTRKHAWADQLSCVLGNGVVATSTHIETGRAQQIPIRPSQSTDFRHGFSSLVKFFPEGRVFTARVEEAMWRALGCFGSTSSPVIFDDQYISTGGQFYEILSGHDRMIADLRPEIHDAVGLPGSLVCHPYDACCWPLLREEGAVFCGLDGQFPDAPLDTTSPVSWVAFANEHLSATGLPALQKAFQECCERHK